MSAREPWSPRSARGRYDPVTNGHVDIIARAAAIFDRVVVGVVREPPHKGLMFAVEERVEFLREALAEARRTSRSRCSPSSSSTSPAAGGRTTMVKGLRAISDFEWEFQMHHLNRTLAPDIETMYLMANPQYSFVSSSGVKEIASFGGNVDELVPRAGRAPVPGDVPDGRSPALPSAPRSRLEHRWTFSFSSTSSTTSCTTRRPCR